MRLLYILTTLSVLLLQACTSSTPKPAVAPEPLLFPPPPEQPRFIFERTLQSSSQLVSKTSQQELREFLTGESDSGTAMSKPFDVSVCHGIVFVSDTVMRSVLVFDVPGSRFFRIGNDKPGTLRKPLGLDTDNDCNLYVADGTANTIMMYDQAGQYIKSLGGMKWFDRLSHVAVDAAGERLYAVDTGGVGSANHHVRVFDIRTGEHLRDIGKRGTGRGEFNLPRDIEVDRNGLIYVVDGGNFRVQVFDRERKYLRQIGKLGRYYGEFARPKGIAVDADGNIYVSDASHGNFQIFNAAGDLLLFVGTRSDEFDRANYMLPAGMDVDEDGRVYIVDQYFRKLDIYRPASHAETEGFLGAWPR